MPRKIEFDNGKAAFVSRRPGRADSCELLAWIIVWVEAISLGIFQSRNKRVRTAACQPEQFASESLIVGLQCLAALAYRKRQIRLVCQQVEEINSDHSKVARRTDDLGLGSRKLQCQRDTKQNS